MNRNRIYLSERIREKNMPNKYPVNIITGKGTAYEGYITEKEAMHIMGRATIKREVVRVPIWKRFKVLASISWLLAKPYDGYATDIKINRILQKSVHEKRGK